MTSASDSEALRRMGDLGVPILARTLRHRDKAALSLALAVAGASSGVQASERLTSGKSSGEELAVAAPVSLPEAEELLGASTSRLEDMAEDARKVSKRISAKELFGQGTAHRFDTPKEAAQPATDPLGRPLPPATGRVRSPALQTRRLVTEEWRAKARLKLRTCNLDASLLEAGVRARILAFYIFLILLY